MNFIFDTNIFRRASEDDAIKEQLLALKGRLGANERHFVCELTLLELNSQLRRDKSRRYQQRRDGMLFARTLTDGRILPLPDFFLTVRLFNNVVGARVDDYRLDWNLYWRHLEASPTITSFKRKPSESFGVKMRRERLSVNSWVIAQVRKEFEFSYIRSMGLHVAPIVGAAHSKRRADKDDPLWQQVRGLVESADFEWEIYRAIADRCRSPLLGTRTPADTTNIERLCAFMVAYKWVLVKMVESGYNYEKNKNDYIDIHLLPYLADPDMTLVTLDQKLKTKVTTCADQANRIMNLADLVKARL